jgi:hypothetical protein
MAVTAPGAGDTVKVVDQSSEYKNKTGTVISANETTQYIMVQFTDSQKSVRLRMTQVKVVGAASGGSVTLETGNNPLGSVHGAGDARHVPKSSDRRDYPGKNFNPSDPTGTLGDARPKLA